MRFLNHLRRRPKSRSSLAHRAQLRVEQLESRLVPYTTSGNAWPHANLVTLSFVPDNTNLGGVNSNLFATFNAKWSTTTWENQVLRAAQVWAQQTNLDQHQAAEFIRRYFEKFPGVTPVVVTSFTVSENGDAKFAEPEAPPANGPGPTKVPRLAWAPPCPNSAFDPSV